MDTSRIIRLAIIDDGIRDEAIPVHDRVIINDETIDTTINNGVGKTHADICASIILAVYSNVELVDIKIIGKNGCGNVSDAVHALDWCKDNCIDVINMSLGVMDIRMGRRLSAAVDRLVKRDVIIVSSYNNMNIPTWPASNKNVYGVMANRIDYSPNNTIYKCKHISNAYVVNTIIDNGEYGEPISYANSYATPCFSAKICEIISNDGGHQNNCVVYEWIKRLPEIECDFFCNYAQYYKVGISLPVIYAESDIISNVEKEFASNGYDVLAINNNELQLYIFRGQEKGFIGFIQEVINPDILILSEKTFLAEDHFYDVMIRKGETKDKVDIMGTQYRKEQLAHVVEIIVNKGDYILE